MAIGTQINELVGYGAKMKGECDFKERNLEDQIMANFAARMDMALLELYFKKEEEHTRAYTSEGKITS